MDNKDLRKYICDNINNLSDIKNNLIYDYIKLNNISHSENKNGLFINLSLCDEKHIDYFYNIFNINDEIDNNIIDNTIDNNIKRTKPKKKIIKNIIIKDIILTPLENKILTYSFQ
tara:strand:- start:419 stop:763 length:345 start_codon:yes stop_codon:yes gene_type:complete